MEVGVSSAEFDELGRIEDIFNGVMLSVYDRERTICDCFKYREKMDRELFCKAVKAYASDPNKNLMNLSSYAREMRGYSRMMDVMEVLLCDC